MGRFIVGLLFATMLCGCLISPSKKLENSEVYITCPDGWKITEVKNYGVSGYFSVEGKGFNSSGLMTFSWFDFYDNNSDLDDMIDEYIGYQKSSFLLKNANLSFSDKYSDEFKGIDCRQTDYTMSIFKIPHQGKIIVFRHKGKTFVITKQGADEDIIPNEKGFRIMEKSFRVTEGF